MDTQKKKTVNECSSLIYERGEKHTFTFRESGFPWLIWSWLTYSFFRLGYLYLLSHLQVGVGFPSLGTVHVWGWGPCVTEAAPCVAGCMAASCAATHLTPVAPPPPVVTTSDFSRHWEVRGRQCSEPPPAENHWVRGT